MNLPDNVVKSLKAGGMSTASYDRQAALHEAAHVAVAIHFGAPIDCIELNSQLGTRAFSRARVVWRVGALTHEHVLTVIAAGVAADRRYAGEMRIPALFLDSVARNERTTFDGYPALQFIDAGQRDRLWNQAVTRADALLDNEQVIACLRRLECQILDALQSEKTVITASEIGLLTDGGSN